MADSGLSPAGSSQYSSDTMYVGDGTWDSSRNTFLLPNLMGLNFETMRYNGMANRFRDMPGYHSLILGHGILAAITFLGVVPMAIMMARFYHRSPRLALRVHIWLQILTIGLTTAVFVLGWFAVGPPRSLTNPHHGIGLAIYVLVLVQAIGGGLIHHTEKGKQRYRIPFKLYLHQLMGRAIALLGIAQVPLGLTLYGSPKYLFILFALWAFTLLIAYLWLCFHFRIQTGFDDGSSYFTGYTGYKTETTDDSRSRRPGLGALAAAGAAGAGIAALGRRSHSRTRSGVDDHTSRVTSQSRRRTSFGDEKYDDGHDTRGHTWRDRLLGATAGIGALAAVRGLFNRRRDREGEVGSYRPATAGATSYTETDFSRVEEGLAPSSPGRDHWRRAEEREAAQAAGMAGGVSVASPARRANLRRRSGGSIDSLSSRSSISGDHVRHDSANIRDGIAALGLAGFLRSKFKQRRRKKEDARVEDMRRREREEERIARMGSQRRRYTGDGVPRRGDRRESLSLTDYSTEISRPGPVSSHPLGSRSHVDGAPTTVTDPSTIPPPPVAPAMVQHESGSEEYMSAGGRHHRRHHLGSDAAAATAAAAAVGAGRRDTSRQRSSGDASVNSPPVSVKVKMHGDGRHVTLRRLNEEEAAAEREARRRERHRRNRNGSLSSVGEGDGERWRRVEAMEAAQAAQAEQSSAAAANAPIPMPPPPPPPLPMPAAGSTSAPGVKEEVHIPPPPPIPGSALTGSVGSPGGTTPYETGTELSRPSTYETNRRRRRAERSAAQRAKGGNRVEFE